MEKTPRTRRNSSSIGRQPPLTGKESGDDASGGEQRPKKPGPIYDTAFRALVEVDPVALCRLLGIPVEQPVENLHSIFITRRLEPDLLLRTGPATLAHFEYVDQVRHDPKKTDLITKMLGYRYAIMRRYPNDRLIQHIVVLGTGRVRGHDELVRRGFALDLKITYLPKMDPETMLAEPSLAPLASLGRGDASARARAYEAAIVQGLTIGGEYGSELIDLAAMIATKNLDRNIIDETYQEAMMVIPGMDELSARWAEHPVGKRLQEITIARYLQLADEQAREQGLEQGLEQGREEFLAILLRDRFGDHGDVPAVARRLSTWQDPAAALQAVKAAQTLADLKG